MRLVTVNLNFKHLYPSRNVEGLVSGISLNKLSVMRYPQDERDPDLQVHMRVHYPFSLQRHYTNYTGINMDKKFKKSLQMYYTYSNANLWCDA